MPKSFRVKKGTSRVVQIKEDVRLEIRSFFGTTKVAYVQLALDDAGLAYFEYKDIVTTHRFYEPAKVALIEEAWSKYKADHNVQIKPIPAELAPKPRTRATRKGKGDEYLVNRNKRPTKPFKFLGD